MRIKNIRNNKNKLGFAFMQEDEFSNPYYAFLYENKFIGVIAYEDDGKWYGNLIEESSYSALIFELMAEMIKELNDDLKKQRSKLFGL